MTSIGLRPATHADSDRCYQLHRAAMRGYVEAIWGWDEADQQAFHHRGFNPDHTRIITVDGHDAGLLIVDYRPDQIYLGRIEIHPDFQGHGIGSRLIGRLLREAADRGQAVELDVLTVNHRAHALYQRLGFHETQRHGPDNIKIRMRAEPH
nr:GNAT family N-acetyltransferase [uncultured Actinoplanes sp.]